MTFVLPLERSMNKKENKQKKKSGDSKDVVCAISMAGEKSSNDKIIKRKNQYPFPLSLCSSGWGEEGSEGLETLINV